MLLYQAGVGVATASDTWRDWNTAAVARELRGRGVDSDGIMSVNPVLAVAYYRENPMLWKRLRYGSAADVAAFAASNGVRFIVVADAIYPHWPIQALWRDEPVPPGWRIALKKDFQRRSARWGEMHDGYLVLERVAAGGEDAR